MLKVVIALSSFSVYNHISSSFECKDTKKMPSANHSDCYFVSFNPSSSNNCVQTKLRRYLSFRWTTASSPIAIDMQKPKCSALRMVALPSPYQLRASSRLFQHVGDVDDVNLFFGEGRDGAVGCDVVDADDDIAGLQFLTIDLENGFIKNDGMPVLL